jgi:hypothetical protein
MRGDGKGRSECDGRRQGDLQKHSDCVQIEPPIRVHRCWKAFSLEPQPIERRDDPSALQGDSRRGRAPARASGGGDGPSSREKPCVISKAAVGSRQGAPRKRSPSGPASGELRLTFRLSHGGWLPDAAWQIPRWTARRDLLSHLCHDGCALWLRNPWAGAPTLQHPPFPQVWCGPLNRTSCMPVAQTDGCIPMHECRHLSPPGCFRIRLRIPPSLSWRNIGACRSAGPRITRLVAQISSVDA